MMLVISVIVAIAILGVLMSILGQVKLGGVNDPASAMKAELTSIVSSGYGTSQPKKIEFAKDAYIDRQSVIGDSPITAEEIKFYCGSDSTALCGGGDAAIDIQNNEEITVLKNTQAYIVVCGNDQRRTNPKYCVGIGRQGADARTACTNECLRNN